MGFHAPERDGKIHQSLQLLTDNPSQPSLRILVEATVVARAVGTEVEVAPAVVGAPVDRANVQDGGSHEDQQ